MSIESRQKKVQRALDTKKSAELATSLGAKVNLTVPAGKTLHLVETAFAYVHGDGLVRVHDCATVYASGDLQVIAEDASRVFAEGCSTVLAKDESCVYLDDSAKVVAAGQSVVSCRGYWRGRAVLRDDALMYATGMGNVEAYDDSHVRVDSKMVPVALHDQATARTEERAKAEAVSPNATIITPPTEDSPALPFGTPVETWARRYGIEISDDGILYVYKGLRRSGKSLSYNEDTNEFVRYEPGGMPEAADWDPARVACGRGLHFSPTLIDTFEYAPDAVRWFRCAVRADEVVTLGDKIKARRVVEPLVEVNVFGEPLAQ